MEDHEIVLQYLQEVLVDQVECSILTEGPGGPVDQEEC